MQWHVCAPDIHVYHVGLGYGGWRGLAASTREHTYERHDMLLVIPSSQGTLRQTFAALGWSRRQLVSHRCDRCCRAKAHLSFNLQQQSGDHCDMPGTQLSRGEAQGYMSHSKWHVWLQACVNIMHANDGRDTAEDGKTGRAQLPKGSTCSKRAAMAAPETRTDSKTSRNISAPSSPLAKCWRGSTVWTS